MAFLRDEDLIKRPEAKIVIKRVDKHAFYA